MSDEREMSIAEFSEMVQDLFEEYTTKVNKTERKAFITALLAEIGSSVVIVDADSYEDEDSEEDVDELDF